MLGVSRRHRAPDHLRLLRLQRGAGLQRVLGRAEERRWRAPRARRDRLPLLRPLHGCCPHRAARRRSADLNVSKPLAAERSRSTCPLIPSLDEVHNFSDRLLVCVQVGHISQALRHVRVPELLSHHRPGRGGRWTRRADPDAPRLRLGAHASQIPHPPTHSPRPSHQAVPAPRSPPLTSVLLRSHLFLWFCAPVVRM